MTQPNSDVFDISGTLVAKSDQLNADDIVAAPITVTITAARPGSDDQPVVLHITGGHKPYKPCKTTRRILATAWGTNAAQWVGRSMTLYNEPTVKWAGKEVGGIRISALSHIDRPLTLSLAESKKSKQAHRIAVLKSAPQQQRPTGPSLSEWCADHGLNEEAVFEWHQQKMNKPLTDVAGFIGFIAGNDKARADLREFAAEPPADDDGGYPPSMQDDEIPF